MLSNSRTFLRLYYQKHQRCYAAIANSVISSEANAEDEKDKRKNILENVSTQNQKPDLQHLHSKLLYSSFLDSQSADYGKRVNFRAKIARRKVERKLLEEKQRTLPLPISLKYFTDDAELLGRADKEEEIIPEPPVSSEFPYKSTKGILLKKTPTSKWMTDYEYFDDNQLQESKESILNFNNSNSNYPGDEEESEEDKFLKRFERQQMRKNYGTPDKNVPVSKVNCGGCGSLLHCKDASIPGYLPREIFLRRSEAQLRSMQCQRCHFLKEYDIALNVATDPAEYPKLLESIRSQRALAVIMVDLLDFPCSIWPGIIDIIGTKRPVVIVGNKVDLLPEDSKGYLKHIRSCLEASVRSSSLARASVRHVALVSAKTGYGVEELINYLHSLYTMGDIYLIGCTNVGKSTLFNALLQSDFCKVEVIDLMQRATISPWPGTTLNLLKFPILRPAEWRVYLRNRRLMSQQGENALENKHRQLLARETDEPKHATLMGHIGRTFVDQSKVIDPHSSSNSYRMNSGFTQSGPVFGFSEKSDLYKDSKWCYDTPGVMHPDQILNILTIEELMVTLPKQLIRPRVFYMTKGKTLFFGGLARFDVLEADKPLRLTAFRSHLLPLTVCETQYADEIYSQLCGTEYFLVPMGNKERLSKWPNLKCGEKDITLSGYGFYKSVADVVLSSAGWVSVTAEREAQSTFRAWTPEARGIHLRSPSLIQYASEMRGKRVQGSPAYSIGKVYYKGKQIYIKDLD